ncbi:MAG: hypothetical protein RIM72_03730 [Alphaproteobacteria bacterium]
MRTSRLFGLLMLGLVVAGCADNRESQPARTATEQLIFSRAVDRVSDSLALEIPVGSKVFMDSQYVEGVDSKYLVASLRDRILRHGGRLVESRESADLVIEPRVGAMSIDRKTTLFGIPSFPIPIPLVGNVEFPELAIYKRDQQQGVIKLAITSFDAKTGALAQSIKPEYGFSEHTDWGVLLFFHWQDNNLVPAPEDKNWVGKSSY